MNELKPCPFCGEMPQANKWITYGKKPQEYMRYVCVNDTCPNRLGEPKSKLLDEWNTRPIEDKLRKRIAELSQAVGLITTLKPTMVMDVDHPLDMAKEVTEYVTARIAKLEATQRWIPVSERLPDNWESVLTIDISKSTRGPVTAFYNLDTNCWSTHFEYDLWVTHWMPLPEPPIVYGKVCEE